MYYEKKGMKEKTMKKTKKQLIPKMKKSINTHKRNLQKELIKVRTGIRVGSGDDYGFTSCAMK